MKTFLVISLFVLTFTLTKCQNEKETKAVEECNAIYPNTGDVRQKVLFSVVTGERMNLDNSSKCSLYCVLQKVKFFDAEGNMQTPGIFKYKLKSVPFLANNSHILLIQLYQIFRSTRGLEDKCYKAMVSYYRLSQAIFVLGIAEEFNNDLGVKDEINKAIVSGSSLPLDSKLKIKQSLQFLDAMLTPDSVNEALVEMAQEKAPGSAQKIA